MPMRFGLRQDATCLTMWVFISKHMHTRPGGDTGSRELAAIWWKIRNRTKRTWQTSKR